MVILLHPLQFGILARRIAVAEAAVGNSDKTASSSSFPLNAVAFHHPFIIVIKEHCSFTHPAYWTGYYVCVFNVHIRSRARVHVRL